MFQISKYLHNFQKMFMTKNKNKEGKSKTQKTKLLQNRLRKCITFPKPTGGKPKKWAFWDNRRVSPWPAP